jgi:hypothetical protein
MMLDRELVLLGQVAVPVLMLLLGLVLLGQVAVPVLMLVLVISHQNSSSSSNLLQCLGLDLVYLHTDLQLFVVGLLFPYQPEPICHHVVDPDLPCQKDQLEVLHQNIYSLMPRLMDYLG